MCFKDAMSANTKTRFAQMFQEFKAKMIFESESKRTTYFQIVQITIFLMQQLYDLRPVKTPNDKLISMCSFHFGHMKLCIHSLAYLVH